MENPAGIATFVKVGFHGQLRQSGSRPRLDGFQSNQSASCKTAPLALNASMGYGAKDKTSLLRSGSDAQRFIFSPFGSLRRFQINKGHFLAWPEPYSAVDATVIGDPYDWRALPPGPSADLN